MDGCGDDDDEDDVDVPCSGRFAACVSAFSLSCSLHFLQGGGGKSFDIINCTIIDITNANKVTNNIVKTTESQRGIWF